MKAFKIPPLDIEKVRFSTWIPWEERYGYKWGKRPCVYLIAITGKNLKGKNPSLGEIVYVGTSFRKGGLFVRWRNLNRSLCGGEGHWAGIRIRKSFGNYKNWKKRKIYVSAWVRDYEINEKDHGYYLNKAVVSLVEQVMIAKVFQNNKEMPKHNKV